MKKIIFWVLIVLPCVINAQKINTVYSFRTYHMAEGNYVEISTSIEASSLKNTLTSSQKYIKQAELTTFICTVSQPDSAVYVDKRIIKTAETEDSSLLNNISLMDMQRIPVTNDTFLVFFELRDVNTNMQPMAYKDAFIMNYNNQDVNVSDIMIIDKYNKTGKENIFSRGGYDIYPYIFDVIGSNEPVINYYVEIYNTDKAFKEDSVYALWTVIEDINTNKSVEGLQVVKRRKTEAITPYLGSVVVSSLNEGSYYLTVEVRDAKNILYAYKRYPFFKQSDNKVVFDNADIPQNAFVNNIPDSSLKENIKCLRPIVSNVQLQYLLKDLKTSSPAQDRYFLYQFYKTIDPVDPQHAWNDYMQKVNIVNNKYSTPIKKGYTTDMGRVMLAYGVPDEIIDEKFNTSGGINNVDKFSQRMNPDLSSSDAKGVTYYPYQIWVYNHTPMGESNRKFVFYAKQSNLGEYFLLHSNAMGELQDMYWEEILSHGSLERGVVGKAGKQYERGHQ